mgnify:CR=1 FL=1
MRRTQTNRQFGLVWLLAMAVLFGVHSVARAQSAPADPDNGAGSAAQAQPDAKSSFEIYGFAMLDIGHDFKQIKPEWFDTMITGPVFGTLRAPRASTRQYFS